MSTITDITVSKIFVLNVAPKTRVLDRFWYDTTNKILKKCVSTESNKTDAECWEPIGIAPSAIKVTVENGQGNSTTLDLQTYVSAVAEGLIEISGQVTNLNNTKADKASLDTKQDKLNYYNEGDNIANITSETTNTNNVVAKNITLGGYERAVEGGNPAIKHGVTASEQGILKVEYNDVAHGNIGTTTIEGDTINFKYDSSEDGIHTSGAINSNGVLYSNGSIQSEVSLTGARHVSVNDMLSDSTLEDNPIICNSSVGLPYLDSLALNGSNDGLAVLMFSERGMLRGVNSSTYNNDTGEEDILFHAGSRTKINIEAQEASQENCIFGSLVDKELSEESSETHIPTSSAVVDYVKKSAPKQTNELYCNYATLETQDLIPTKTFSCVATIAMTLKEYDAHKSHFPGFMGTLAYWTDNGTGWSINRLGNNNGYIGFGANNKDGTPTYKAAYILDYLDGKPHSWLVTYNGVDTLKFLIDGKEILTLNYIFVAPYTTNGLRFGRNADRALGVGYEYYGILGKLSRVRCFNFDISQDNPVYTIKDYNEGKEPVVGMLDNTNLTPTLNMSAVNTSDYSVDEEGNVHILTSKSLYPRIFNNVFQAGKAYKVKYTTDFYYDSPVTIKLRLPTRNAKVKCLNTGYEYYTDQLIDDSNCFLYQNEGSYAAGSQKFEFEFEFIAELRTNSNTNADTACVYINPVNLESGDSYFKVEVEELAALTYLADFSVEDTKTIPDLTARQNDAIFVGEITGTQDAVIESVIESFIQPTVDELNEKIEEVENIAGDLSGVADIVDQRLEQLGRQIIVNTHSDSFVSTDVTFVSIYTDESKAALPGRIMIQPKLSNVAPMYFGENVSDKTKAFPLYPDQITDFYFEDINNFKVASDAVGDGCNFVIEWGVTNVVADIASAFTMYDDNGNKFKIKIANGGLVAEQLN